jgi:hypothetical protein
VSPGTISCVNRNIPAIVNPVFRIARNHIAGICAAAVTLRKNTILIVGDCTADYNRGGIVVDPNAVGGHPIDRGVGNYRGSFFDIDPMSRRAFLDGATGDGWRGMADFYNSPIVGIP